MGQILLLIIGLVLLVVIFVMLTSRREARKHGTSTGEEFVGICKLAIETASQKNERKQKIMELLKERELSNADIRKALGVSARSVVRYLDELEREGKAEQVGAIGYTVIYRLK